MHVLQLALIELFELDAILVILVALLLRVVLCFVQLLKHLLLVEFQLLDLESEIKRRVVVGSRGVAAHLPAGCHRVAIGSVKRRLFPRLLQFLLKCFVLEVQLFQLLLELILEVLMHVVREVDFFSEVLYL